MYVLDTNVISEVRKLRPHGGVLAWYRSVPAIWRYIPSIPLYEMQAGVELTREQNPRRAEEISRWIDEAEHQMQILPLDGPSARLAARLMHDHPSEMAEDAMIAAIARIRRMIVVTRNIKHFNYFDVPLINPFEYKDKQP